jgi:hypothetical protein
MVAPRSSGGNARQIVVIVEYPVAHRISQQRAVCPLGGKLSLVGSTNPEITLSKLANDVIL